MSQSNIGVTTSGAEVTHKGNDIPCSSGAPKSTSQLCAVFKNTDPVAKSGVILYALLSG
jgi:hypothetical protein